MVAFDSKSKKIAAILLLDSLLTVTSILGLALALCVGLTFQILACALPNVWWPLFGMLCYILAPLPAIFGGAVTKKMTGVETNPVFNQPSSGNIFFVDLGLFLSTFLLFSGLAMPLVFLHTDVIVPYAALLSVCGGIIVYTTILAFMFFLTSDQKEKVVMI